MATNPEVQRIISFWFDRNPIDWFVPPEGFDDECKSRFGHLISKALSTTELDAWAAEPDGSLALLVLLDQLTRNVYRGSPEAFSGDLKAAEIATRAIARGFDNKFPAVRAVVFYAPLMHSESLLSQVAATALFRCLKARCQNEEISAMVPFVDRFIQVAEGHMGVIERFGRYPSRNAVLGRENTSEEDAFLKEHPTGFPAKTSS